MAKAKKGKVSCGEYELAMFLRMEESIRGTEGSLRELNAPPAWFRATPETPPGSREGRRLAAPAS